MPCMRACMRAWCRHEGMNTFLWPATNGLSARICESNQNADGRRKKERKKEIILEYYEHTNCEWSLLNKGATDDRSTR